MRARDLALAAILFLGVAGCESPQLVDCSRTANPACNPLSCPVGFYDCNGDRTDGCETDLSARASCGACSVGCEMPTPYCGLDTMGRRACVAACGPSAPDACSGSCVDLSTDLSHCGACSTSCRLPRARTTCTNGICALVGCTSGFADCDGALPNGCETPLTTLSDCGACGQACALPNADGDCATGVCLLGACHAGFADCNGDPRDGCEANLSAPPTCGTCANACVDPTPLCGMLPSGGRGCVSGCSAPTPDRCGGTCVDTQTDLGNCGRCGAPCSRANAVTTCTAGACVLGSCNALWANCDGDPANGCERPTNTLTDCGACGTPCAFLHSIADCSTGACRFAGCSPGWHDCNGTTTDGCETPDETACTDGVDNDCDGAIDCADANCTGAACNDGNVCTTGDACQSWGGCAGAATGTPVRLCWSSTSGSFFWHVSPDPRYCTAICNFVDQGVEWRTPPVGDGTHLYELEMWAGCGTTCPDNFCADSLISFASNEGSPCYCLTADFGPTYYSPYGPAPAGALMLYRHVYVPTGQHVVNWSATPPPGWTYQGPLAYACPP